MKNFSVLSLSAILMIFLLFNGSFACAQSFHVIINIKNPVESLTTNQVANIFLKKETTWNDGIEVKPVDQTSKSMVRKSFSQTVLKRPVFAVRSYWQNRIFSGRGVPPLELESDAAVVKFVEAHPGAIGYISEKMNNPHLKFLPIR